MAKTNTTTAAILAYIRKAGHPVGAAELRERFGVGKWGMRYHLTKMRKAGAIRTNGGWHAHKTQWVPHDPKVDLTDRRGLHVNSLRNLKCVMDNKKLGRPRSAKHSQHWAGATELEKLWMSGSDSLDILGRRLSNSPREGAPGKNVDAPVL